MEKVNHDYVCKDCGAIATKHYQETHHSYDIDKNGNFINEESWEGNVNEFYCDDCFENSEG